MRRINMPIALIVDGHSSGRYYPETLKDQGYTCVHVQSTKKPIKALGAIDKTPYAHEFIYEGDLEKLAEEINRKYPGQIACVIAGSEAGVSLADELSEKLGVRSNGTKKSKARRDKYEMVEVLRSQGIKTVEHFKSKDLTEILSWTKKHGKWPVVLKPISSAGTDGVYICNNEKEVEAAYQVIKGKKNVFEQENFEVLVQSYLDGQEYVVNSINCIDPASGKPYHFVNDIWLCKKQEFHGHRIYDYERLLSFDGEAQRKLVAYINNVLEALEINYGPSHAEVMLTADGPILVEVASRFSGGTNPGMSMMCVGYNPLELAVLSFTDPKKFFTAIAAHENPGLDDKKKTSTQETTSAVEKLRNRSVKKYAAVLDLATNLKGEVVAIPLKEELETAGLQSIYSVKFKVSPGQEMTPTVSLLTSPVQFHLVHPDESTIVYECEKIKTMGEKGFTVAPQLDQKPTKGMASLLVANSSITSPIKNKNPSPSTTPSKESEPVQTPKIVSKL